MDVRLGFEPRKVQTHRTGAAQSLASLYACARGMPGFKWSEPMTRPAGALTDPLCDVSNASSNTRRRRSQPRSVAWRVTWRTGMASLPGWACSSEFRLRRRHGERGDLPGDIDVPFVGDGIDRADLYDAAERAEACLRMPVNPVVRPAGSWDEPGKDAVLLQTKSRPCGDITRRSQ